VKKSVLSPRGWWWKFVRESGAIVLSLIVLLCQVMEDGNRIRNAILSGAGSILHCGNGMNNTGSVKKIWHHSDAKPEREYRRNSQC